MTLTCKPKTRTRNQGRIYCSVKLAGYWSSSFFACLWTETEPSCLATMRQKIHPQSRGHSKADVSSVSSSLKSHGHGFFNLNKNHDSIADEGLTLETSAIEPLYGGQFTLSTQLIKLNHLVILPTVAAPQFL